MPAKPDSPEIREKLALTSTSVLNHLALMASADTPLFAPTLREVFRVDVHPVHLVIHLFNVLPNIPVKVMMRVQEMPCVKTASATAHLLSLVKIANVSDLSFSVSSVVVTWLFLFSFFSPPVDPCEQLFCGEHAKCELDSNGLPVCVCAPGYIGKSNSLPGCVGRSLRRDLTYTNRS